MSSKQHVLLSGIVGSTAYGLAGPDSDVDVLGVYAAPTADFHGLNLPVGRAGTVVKTSPDSTLHEAGRFVSLCLGGNPTVNELLWLDEYRETTPLGEELVSLRSCFLSRSRVRDAYYGYAKSQFTRLLNSGQFESTYRARMEKHARHLLRLLDQGVELYSTGRLTIKVSNPDRYRNHAAEIATNPNQALRFLHEATESFDTNKSPLPDSPNEARVERWLKKVRLNYLPWSINVTLSERPRLYVPDTTLPKTILVDIDGTVALRNGREPFDWDRVGEDIPNFPIIDLVASLCESNYAQAVFVSGRPEECRNQSEIWLNNHITFPWKNLYMRKDGDNRSDVEVKKEIFDQFISPTCNVLYAVDDRNQVVALWRAMCIPTTQVADGPF